MVNSAIIELDQAIAKDLDEAYDSYVGQRIPSKEETRIYESIGVPLFGKALMKTIGGLGRGRSSNYHVGSPTVRNLKAFALETVKNEQRHMPPLFIGALGMMGTGIFGSLGFASLFLASNVLHAYPIMLQRYNRRRVAEIVSKRESKRSRKDLEEVVLST